MENHTCNCCGEKFRWNGDEPTWACPECLELYPPSLIKAAGDDFDYALGLTDGTILRFSRAEFHGEWVTIIFGEDHTGGEYIPDARPYGFPFPRGLDVRLDTIVWCADAPNW